MWIEQLKRIMERNPHMKSDASYTALGYSKKGFGMWTLGNLFSG
ncbi:hypothetical protein ACVNRM_20870 [Bacillus paranthracis]|nr:MULTISPECIES: hypothetical protein [Bacillus]MDA1574722.1 hypothetical protein [Bacillus cereus group sp. TH242-3LC]MDA1827384.1 hypothetical protein [Bacillus cereus group sp. BY25LC]